MFASGQARPDHETIAKFRRHHLATFLGLCSCALWLCQAARLAIDGTKVKAN